MTRKDLEEEIRRIFQYEQATFDGKIKMIANLVFKEIEKNKSV